MDANHLSVVVLNHNGQQILPLCLEALAPHLDGAELVVIDNGSTDGSGQLAHGWNARVVVTDNQHGFITGLNAAFEHTSRRWVCFLQNDVLFHRETLTRLCWASQHVPFYSVCQPVLWNQDGSLNHAGGRYRWPGVGIGNRSVQRAKWQKPVVKIDLFATACFLMRRGVFREVGPFDERLAPAYYEDVDYSLRMERLGFPRYLCPEAEATHLSTYTFHRLHSKRVLAQFCQRNRRYLVQKHYRRLPRWSRLAGLRVLDWITTDARHGDTYRPSPPR